MTAPSKFQIDMGTLIVNNSLSGTNANKLRKYITHHMTYLNALAVFSQTTLGSNLPQEPRSCHTIRENADSKLSNAIADYHAEMLQRQLS